MLFGGFRTRSLSRDKRTDEARFDRLTQFLGGFRSEIEGEAKGLRSRFESTQAVSAFAELSAEAEGGDATLMKKSDQAAYAMAQYGMRLRTLGQQAEFVAKVEAEARQFSTAIRSS